MHAKYALQELTSRSLNIMPNGKLQALSRICNQTRVRGSVVPTWLLLAKRAAHRQAGTFQLQLPIAVVHMACIAWRTCSKAECPIGTFPPHEETAAAPYAPCPSHVPISHSAAESSLVLSQRSSREGIVVMRVGIDKSVFYLSPPRKIREPLCLSPDVPSDTSQLSIHVNRLPGVEPWS